MITHSSNPLPHNLPPEIQQAYSDYLRDRMATKLADIPDELVARTEDSIEARGVTSIIASAGIGFLSGGWAGAVIGAVGAFMNLPPKPPQNPTEIQGTTGFGNTGQAIGRPGQLIPVVHCNANINPNGGRRLAGIPIFTEIVTQNGRQERNVKYLLSLGRIGAIEEDETLIDEQPRTLYLRDELTFQFRTGADVQSPINGMAYYSQVVQPKQFRDVLLDLRGEVGQIISVSETGVGFVNVEVPEPAMLCNNGPLPSGMFGTQAVDPDIGGDIRFQTPNGAAGVGLSTNEIDQTATSADYGIVFDGNGQYTIVENGAVVAGPFPYQDVSVWRITVSQATPANPPAPAIPSQVSYSRSGQLIYTSIVSPTAPLFLDVGITEGGVCIDGIEVSNTPLTTQVESQFQLRLAEEEDFEKFNALELYHVCPDIYFKILSKNEEQKTLIIEAAQQYSVNSAPPSAGFGDLEGEEIYRYEYIRYENTKRIGGRGGDVAQNGRNARFNMSYNLHAFDENNKSLLHGLVYDVFIRRVDQPNMSHLIRFYTEDQLRRTTFSMFDVQNLPLGRYYWEIRPVICDCDGANQFQMPSNQLGVKTCYQSSVAGSPILLRFTADNDLDPSDDGYLFLDYWLVIGLGSAANPPGTFIIDREENLDPSGTLPTIECNASAGAGVCTVVDGISRIAYPIFVDDQLFTYIYVVGKPVSLNPPIQYEYVADDSINPEDNPCLDSCLSTYPIYELDDFGGTRTITVPYDAGDGPVQVLGEIDSNPRNPAEILRNIQFDRKEDISSQQNHVARVEFVSEQVTPDKHVGTSYPDAVSYPGFATPAITFRDTSLNGNISYLCSEGIEAFNHLEAGLNPETQPDPIRFTDPLADFTDAGLAVGMVIEDVLTGQTAQIVAIESPTTLLLDRPVAWTPCGFYRAGFIGAINYYPDVLVYYILNQDVGIGSYFPMPEFFIDWGAIALCRRYVEANGYFYDRVMIEPVPFRQWAEDEAKNSHLLLNVCGGMFEPIIDEAPTLPDDIAFNFNASNTEDFRIEALRQQDSRANTCIVTYPDGRRDGVTVGGAVGPPSFSHDGHARFRPQSITIETAERAAGDEPLSEITYESDSITNEYQAVAVGALHLKRRRARRQATFRAPWAGLNVKSGDWVTASEKRFDGSTVWSGYVSEIVEPWDSATGLQVIKISDCLIRYRACLSTVADGLVQLVRDSGIAADVVKFLSVNDIIQDYEGNEYQITSIDDATGAITFSPAVAWDDLSVLFLKSNFDGDEAIVFHYATGNAEEVTALTGILEDDGSVCIELATNEAIAQLDPITIGPMIVEKTLYQVSSTTPDEQDTVVITATEASPDHYTTDDLVIRYDDAAIIA